MTDQVAQGREGYYLDAVVAGEPPGVWYGRGAAVMGLAGEVDPVLLAGFYGERLDPRDPVAAERARWGEAARLGRAPRRYRSADELYAQLLAATPGASPEVREGLRRDAERRAHQAVSFYDLTFSPSKTVTTLWAGLEQAAVEALAAGDSEHVEFYRWAAGQVEEAVMTGARAVVDFVEAQACYARVGHHGGGAGRWVQGSGLVAAMFLQHDTRNGDPLLHVHVAADNIVCRPDGQWVALDGRTLHEARGAAGAVGERACEADLFARLGVPSATRPDGKAREVLGASENVADALSTRSHDIEAWLAGATARFVETMGREPNGREREQLHERAFLATRKPKSHTAISRPEQLARWDAQARAVRGDGLAGEARAILATAAERQAGETWSPEDVIERALAAVAGKHARWTRWQLLRAVSDALPGHLGLGSADEVRALLDGLTDAGLARAVQLTPGEPVEDLPAELLRADGSSSYARPGGVYYATVEALGAEHTLRAGVAPRLPPRMSAADADAVVARYAESGRELGGDQVAVLRGVLTSNATVEVLSAPAGTGKSFTVAALADAWQTDGGRVVFGLAPSQVAAHVLAALAGDGLTTANTSRWLGAQERLATGHAVDGDERFRLHAGDLLVVDEAAMASTDHLAQVQQRCAAAGVKLLLVGDTHQLGAVGPGGGFADLAERAPRYELVEVRRFAHDWEAAASLRLRDRDTSVLAEYDRRGRLIGAGTREDAERSAARAWLADTLAGRESLLMVDTNEQADRLAGQLRQALVRHGRVGPNGVWIPVRGYRIGRRDLVQARRNAWHLADQANNSYAPVNRETYRVLATRSDGGLVVARVTGHDQHGGEQLAAPLTLPASYVAEHVALAYATTMYGAQGRSVDTSHGVITPATGAAGVYVPLTRGRETNTAHVATRALAEVQETGEVLDNPETTPVAVLAGILEDANQSADHELDESALTYTERAQEQADSVMVHVDRLAAEIADLTAAQTAAVLDRLAEQGLLAGEHRMAVAGDEHYRSLLSRLRTAQLSGHTLDDVLTAAVTERDLTGTRSVADVLHSRIGRALAGQLTPTLTTFQDLVPADAPRAWRQLWQQRAEDADARRHELGARLGEQPPAWALAALGPVPSEALARATWEHKAGWAAAYGELAGHRDTTNPVHTPPPAREAEKVACWRTARHALGLPDADTPNPAHELSAGALRAHVAAGQRVRDRMGRYVTDDELATAVRQAAKHRADATLWADLAARAADPGERAHHGAAAEQARQQAEAAEHASQLLDELAESRAADQVHHAVTLDRAATAQATLDDLGIPVEDEPQVSAQEWLAAHRQAVVEDDEHRHVLDEADLAEVSARREVDLATLSEPTAGGGVGVEAGVSDPAEGLTRHPTEDRDRDPGQRRRIPTTAELVEDVARARACAAQRRLDAARDADEEAHRWWQQSCRWRERDQGAEQEQTLERDHTDARGDELVVSW